MKLTHILLASVIVLCGCNNESKTITESNILESTGTLISPSRNWRIEFSDVDNKLKIMRRVNEEDQAGGTFDWTNHPGAFTYVDKEDYVWVSDGDSRVVIAGMTNSIGLTFWGLSTWDKEVPSIISHRLPNRTTIKPIR